MFSGDKNIKTIEELVAEIKNYFELQKKYVGLECVSKLVILLSALILGMIMFLRPYGKSYIGLCVGGGVFRCAGNCCVRQSLPVDYHTDCEFSRQFVFKRKQ